MLSDQELLSVLNEWNLWGDFRPKAHPRTGLIQRIKPSLSNHAFVTVLTGVRRSGKSTLGHLLLGQFARSHSLAQTLYLNFEDPKLAGSLNLATLERLYDLYQTKIVDNDKKPQLNFFDEIQHIPNWERFVRTLLEKKTRQKIIISGSSATLLSRELSSSLTGRTLSYEIFPLSFSEFLEFNHLEPLGKRKESKKLNRLLDSYLTFGGFPEVVLEKNINLKKQILKELFTAILDTDIVIRHRLTNRLALHEFALRLINQTANFMSAYEQEKSLNITFPTALEYLSHLEESYLFNFLTRLTPSLKGQRRHPRKIFPVDPGLYTNLAFITTHQEATGLEASAFLHLRRQHQKLWYWQDTHHDVDLVYRDDTGFHPVNVTWSLADSKVREREEAGLITAAKAVNSKTASIIIKSPPIPNPKTVDDITINYISATDFLLS